MEQKRFKCKDEVIVSHKEIDLDIRREVSTPYCYGVFSHYETERGKEHAVINGFHYQVDFCEILPYEGNEHLVGTRPIEYFTLEKGETIIVNDDFTQLSSVGGLISNFEHIAKDKVFVGDCGRPYRYCIPFSKFKLNNAEENRKNILMVSEINGKLVKAIREE